VAFTLWRDDRLAGFARRCNFFGEQLRFAFGVSVHIFAS
jgi:hypothetical protein